MGIQELHYMKSLLIHFREDNNAIRDDIARCHKQKKRIWNMINKNLKSLMRYLVLMHSVRALARHREVDEGSGRNRRDNDYSDNSQICQDDENLPTLTRNPNSIHEL